MKTKRLIDWLNSVPTWYVSDGRVLDEIIKRLEELKELKKHPVIRFNRRKGEFRGIIE